MSTAIFVGGSFPQRWSNPSDWAGNVVPSSSPATNVILASASTEDLGSAHHPFVVHDITSGLGIPAALIVTGFLHADNMNDLTIYTSDPGSPDPSSPAGSINISGNTNKTAFDILGDDSTVRIGHDIKGSTFSFEYGAGLQGDWAENAKLILVNPPKGDLPNTIVLPPPIPPVSFPGTLSFSLEIELGKLHFDHASFIPTSGTPAIPPAMGASTLEDIQLSENGKVVYNLSNVTMPNSTNGSGVPLAGTLSTGYDRTTGYDYVAYSHP
jgi:hypothetical protein